MEYDHEALETKRNELEALVLSAVSDIPNSGNIDASHLISVFAQLTPPQEPEMVFELMTIHSSGRSGGHSRKPGNLLLNWSKLIDIVPDITLASAGALTLPPWIVPFLGLYVWNKIRRGIEEPLSDVEATIILTFWKNKNSENRINEEIGYSKLIELRKTLNLSTISKDEYVAAVNRLVKMGCIELKNGVVWLCEWIKVTY